MSSVEGKRRLGIQAIQADSFLNNGMRNGELLGTCFRKNGSSSKHPRNEKEPSCGICEVLDQVPLGPVQLRSRSKIASILPTCELWWPTWEAFLRCWSWDSLAQGRINGHRLSCNGTLVDSHMLLAFPAFKAKINDGPALRNCLQWTACDKGPVNTSHTCPWKLKHTLLGCIVLLKRDRLAKRLKSQSLPLELQEGCNEKT